MSSAEKEIAKYKSLRKIVQQLKSCGYECEAGLLTNNVAFIALERMAEKERWFNTYAEEKSRTKP